VAVLKWASLCPETELRPRAIRISGSYGHPWLGEVLVLDGDGQPVAFQCSIPALCDEQETMPESFTFQNSSYFDEIYHARTAWEHLNNVAPYEISHPPLGKIIIGIGISLFGMNPFGWRFSGTLFGVLMLPAMYVFLKKLFGSRQAAACGTVVFATDFMHFVQTRIATIDTYAVFFILLMYLSMAVFLMTDSLKALALSGISFGLGCACKWTCVYAGAGLAVLWAGYWIGHRKRGFPAFVKNCLFCVGFFVVMPCLIYYLAYIPYGRAAGIKGVFNREYLDIVLSNQTYMFTYHAGLVAEHPYSSRWYQWLLDIRPILYYLQYFDDGSRSSFGAFLNPVLCWGGLLALAVCLYRAIFRLDRTAMFILIGYLAQLLPWVLVTRLTFAYHYFPCCVFLVLAIGYVFRLMEDGTPHCRVYLWGFAGLSAAVFVLFFPALTGLRVDNAAATQLMGWLPTWPF
jgi:dolichyl-phosphate-mannose--protein O-mannosyl transferase